MESDPCREPTGPTPGRFAKHRSGGGWFARFLKEATDTIGVVAALAKLAANAFIAVDDTAHAELAGRMKEHGVSARLLGQRFLPLALAKDLGVRRIVVIDTAGEEAARPSSR